MKHSLIDFNRISQALDYTLEAIQGDLEPSEAALENLKNAQNEFQQALSFSLSHQNGQQ